MTKQKKKPSGSAIFMYCVIALGVILSTVCFSLYYSHSTDSGVVLWTGIVALWEM